MQKKKKKQKQKISTTNAAWQVVTSIHCRVPMASPHSTILQTQPYTDNIDLFHIADL